VAALQELLGVGGRPPGILKQGFGANSRSYGYSIQDAGYRVQGKVHWIQGAGYRINMGDGTFSDQYVSKLMFMNKYNLSIAVLLITWLHVYMITWLHGLGDGAVIWISVFPRDLNVDNLLTFKPSFLKSWWAAQRHPQPLVPCQAGRRDQ
jgi:hypothetical protein